jgi:ubiquinone/menaquinone biosynthesis C-methylase UbiE
VDTGCYVHGYSERESVRLSDQARTLSSLLHHDTFYPAGARVLEAGCGVGSQTVVLARNNPQVSFVSVDICPQSLDQARTRIEKEKIRNVQFEQADLFRLPYPPDSFDHVFLCFVLEHVPDPVSALHALMRILKPAGTLTAIEGDHGSAYFYPDNEYSHRAIRCLVDLQAQAGGDALIGRRLYPLFVQAGLKQVKVGPRVVYADASRPELVEGFTKNTFAAMVEGVEQKALEAGMMSREDWRRGIEGLYRAAEEDGTFNYTFFKAVGIKP